VRKKFSRRGAAKLLTPDEGPGTSPSTSRSCRSCCAL